MFNLRWITLGDFNSTLSKQERINQGIFYSIGDINFMNRVNLANLIELEFTGNFYTWRGGTKFSVHNKIDRVFIIECWNQKFSEYGVHFVSIL